MADSLRGYGSFSNPRGHPSPCSAQPGDSDTPCLSARGCGCRARPKGLDRRYRQVHLPVPIPLSDGTVGAPGDTAGPAGRRAPSTAHDPFTTFFSVRPAIFRLLGLLGTESLHPGCLGPLLLHHPLLTFEYEGLPSIPRICSLPRDDTPKGNLDGALRGTCAHSTCPMGSG
jgi:hypothetical protein